MLDRMTYFNLDEYKDDVNTVLEQAQRDRLVQRMWQHDYTLWSQEPTDASNRLGWLHIAGITKRNASRMYGLLDELRSDGYDRAVVLGMGGSSLAPDLFARTFGNEKRYGSSGGFLDLSVLDSTAPEAVLAFAGNPAKTLFIVSTKSGGTTETLSFLKFFYNHAANTLGSSNAGQHFVAITDPGSKLAEMAESLSFRAVFLNDSTIGGRYSALSYFGMVPAVLMGICAESLLDRAKGMMANCSLEEENTGLWLGAVMAELAKRGRDKLTLITSPGIDSFGAWVEQLIAESTGKEGKGILPIDGEIPTNPKAYGDDRLFVYLRLFGDDTHDDDVRSLVANGQPVIQLNLRDRYDLGGEFFRWEMAVAVAGHFMDINPFDQPNVESAKVQARKMVADYEESGQLPEPAAASKAFGITTYTDIRSTRPKEALNLFLKQAREKDYIAIQAYVNPTDEISGALQELRLNLRDRSGLATTVGYGPRFLHSTGQMHKGDSGNGLFIQITAADKQDVPIPAEAGVSGSSITFGVLKTAQALGDRQALLNAGRRVIRFHIEDDVVSGLKRLI